MVFLRAGRGTRRYDGGMGPYATWDLPARHIGRCVHVYDAVTSTNDLAAALANDPANAGIAVLASVQTAGRGQYGRTWVATPGSGVLLSVLLFPPAELRRPSVLTAWAAVAVTEAIRRTTGHQARIKWPNDILIRGRKVCGILIESVLTTHRSPFAVVGIGLNVNQSLDELAATELPNATSLAAVANRTFSAADVAKVVLDELDQQYATLLDGELTMLESLWTWRVGLLGHSVAIEATDGTTHLGRLIGMALTGLCIEKPGGIRESFAPEAIRHVVATDRK